MVGVASHTSGVLLSRPHMSSVVRSLFFAECACRGGDVCRPSPPPPSSRTRLLRKWSFITTVVVSGRMHANTGAAQVTLSFRDLAHERRACPVGFHGTCVHTTIFICKIQTGSYTLYTAHTSTATESESTLI